MILKEFRIGVLLILLAACTTTKQVSILTPSEPALQLYQTLPDQEEKKTLLGFLNKEQLTSDTAFGWYATNLKYFKVDSTTVQRIHDKKDKLHLMLFCGTWCHDSQQLVPKYLTTLEAAGVPDSSVTIVGVDRQKHTIARLSETFHVVNVPTMIVLNADGTEVGRIVEYGKTALVDRELGELVANNIK